MTTTAIGAVLHDLRRCMLCRDGVAVTDGELLEQFVAGRDEAAFEALMGRHGPMVLGVCRRVLRNDADADDAFQATFLVLVRKAASIRPRGLVGNWLYGVAHTTALKARAMSSKRAVKERAAATQRPAVAGENWEQLQGVLDQELKGLPDLYRAVIVLCDLEGKTIKQAAQQIGCPQGTVGTRLARGRRMLARRLTRQGITLSGGAIATVVAQNAVAASVPRLLMKATVQAVTVGTLSARVAALTEGVMKAMLLSKLKTTTAAILTVAALGVGIGVGGFGSSASAQDGRYWVAVTNRAEFVPQGGPGTAQPPTAAEQKALRKATHDGAYSILLRKIEVPSSRDTYGDFHVYGPWTGTEYAGHTNLPPGHWVYSFPHWYIWANEVPAEKRDERKATVGAKYDILLRKIEVPTDREQYKDFNDFGYWSGTSHAGHDDLPPGYWVYVYPNWYIWGTAADGDAKADKKASIATKKRVLTLREAVRKQAGEKDASVEGKYRRLLKKIEVPSDRKQYEDFHDYGYAPAQTYAGHDDLPAGYWVYVYPHWHIWGETREPKK